MKIIPLYVAVIHQTKGKILNIPDMLNTEKQTNQNFTDTYPAPRDPESNVEIDRG